MEREKQIMERDLTEIFNEEYEKRYLITPTNTAEKLTEKGYRKETQGEWISVEDRLPEETQDYLVVLNNEDIDIRLFNSKNDPYQTWYSVLNKFLFVDNKGDWHSTDRVTHWMPLPTPPKMKGEE